MTLSENDLNQHLRNIDEVGYILVESAIEPDLIDDLYISLVKLEKELRIHPGCNSFEGHHTIRIYNLLARDRIFEQVPVHPSLLSIDAHGLTSTQLQPARWKSKTISHLSI